MKEYIERETACAIMQQLDDEDVELYGVKIAEGFDGERAISALKSILAADVRPVVLCKDCVYSDKWYADRLICYLWNEHDGNAVFEDGFCNYGLKREEN